jgi:hypothetical protein
VVGIGIQFDDFPKPDHEISFPWDIREQHRDSVRECDGDNLPLSQKLPLDFAIGDFEGLS